VKGSVKKLWQNKTFRIVLILAVALLLLLAVWLVFFPTSTYSQSTAGGYQPTTQETRLSKLLTEIEGVGKTTVMIGEENGVPKSAIVVFQGEDGFLTRMRVIEVTATALNISPTDVLVYPSV
jgi:hypothetical protein